MRPQLTPVLKLFLTAVCALLLTACGRTPLQEQQAYVFGTRVEVLVVSEDPEQGRKAVAAVLREFDRLHRSYHAWQASELTILNSAIFSGRPSESSPELAEFVREAQSLSKQGDYLFDPGIGQLIKLWGFQADEFKAELPPPDDIKNWLSSKPSIADIAIDGQTISSRNRQVALDFGGYLKGVALDRAAAILRAQGIHNALINIGGNVMALGSKEGKPWRVGIQHPRQPGPLATVTLADGEAIGTSGDYQRFFEVDGQRYAHLLDPRSGYPADHTQAVTVLIPAGPKAGTLSDAASKPIFIAGPDGWRDMAKKMEIGLVLRVDRDNRIFVTEALRQRLEFIGQPPEITVVP
jgi:thiamine biosynthesis lipoprotein